MRLLSVKDYPKSIKITSEVEYQIKFVKRIEGAEDEEVFGEINLDDKVILIKRKQAPEEMFKTFIHEVFHAFEEEYNIKMSHTAIRKLESAVFNLLFMNF